MAAPVPPGGGAGGPGGGPPPPPPPLPPPGLAGPAGPPGPPGPPPAGAALLAQLVAAMQAAATGLPAPGPGPAPLPPRVKISPPIFKGLPGERPEAHLLRANDWMDTYNILPVNKPLILSTPSTTWLESGMIRLHFPLHGVTCNNSSVGTSLPREGLLSICMTSGETFHSPLAKTI